MFLDGDYNMNFDSNKFRTLVETVPIVIWSLFLGPFLDTYPNATFLIMLISVLADIFTACSSLAVQYFYESSKLINYE